MTELSQEEMIDTMTQENIMVDNNQGRSFFHKSAMSNNNYVKWLKQNSGLHIMQEDRAINLYNTKGHMGMMHLFLPVEVLNSYCTYTDK